MDPLAAIGGSHGLTAGTKPLRSGKMVVAGEPRVRLPMCGGQRFEAGSQCRVAFADDGEERGALLNRFLQRQGEQNCIFIECHGMGGCITTYPL